MVQSPSYRTDQQLLGGSFVQRGTTILRRLPAFKWTGLLIVLSLLLTLFPMSVVAGNTPDGISEIRWEEVFQYIDGFGGSYTFNKGATVHRLPEPVRTQILDMVFSQEDGIGISILRIKPGSGGINEWGNDLYDGPSDTIMPTPDGYVWDDPDWESKKDEFDKYQIWIVREAAARGCNTILSTVWSPPAWMKTNGSVMGGALRTDMYQAFADYLAEYVLGYKEHFDIDIDYISIANEPNLSPGYSGCTWNGTQLNNFIKNNLGPTFAARGVTAGIVFPEHMSFQETLASTALQDPETVPYIAVMGTHAYGLNVNNVPDLPLSKAAGVKIWQTEYMNQGSPQDNTFVNNTMTDGLKWARLMGDMFTIPNLNAYFWWWPAANNGADGSDLIRLCNDGFPQYPEPSENGLYRVFKRYYAFGNYSRFIEPGFYMIGADKSPTSGVMVTAYKDPATGKFAIVAVNSNAEDQAIQFELADFPAGIGSVVPYRTSESAFDNLRKLDDIAVTNDGFTAVLKANSVTTFVPKVSELPGLNTLKDVFSTYEAEENDGQPKGAVVVDHATGQALTGLKDGDSLVYRRVNFADGSGAGTVGMEGTLSMYARVASLAGGYIEVRLDDPQEGYLIGSFELMGLNDPARWVDLSTAIDTSAMSGIHDMYLVFKSYPGFENKTMFSVDRFAFDDGRLLPPFGSGADLLTNGGFESTSGWWPVLPANWVRSHGSSGTVASVTNPRLSGSRAAGFSARPSDDPTVGISQDITGKLTDRSTYDVNGWFRAYNAGFGEDTAQIFLRATTAEETILIPVGEAQISEANTWVQVENRFQYLAPEGVTRLQFVLTTADASTSFYVDDVSLAEYDPMPEVEASLDREQGDIPGWYGGNTRLFLTAAADSAPLKAIFYRVNGGKWIEYKKAPVFTSGMWTIDYYGVSDSDYIQKPQQISFGVDAVFKGFSPPLGKGKGATSVRRSSAVPVKFDLTDFNGKAYGDAQAWLDVAKLVGGEPGEWVPASAKGNSNDGNAFRTTGKGKYMYNLDTKDLDLGMHRLRVTLTDGNQYIIDIDVR